MYMILLELTIFNTNFETLNENQKQKKSCCHYRTTAPLYLLLSDSFKSNNLTCIRWLIFVNIISGAFDTPTAKAASPTPYGVTDGILE